MGNRALSSNQALAVPRDLPYEDAGVGGGQTGSGEPCEEAGVVAQAVEGAECNDHWR